MNLRFIIAIVGRLCQTPRRLTETAYKIDLISSQ